MTRIVKGHTQVDKRPEVKMTATIVIKGRFFHSLEAKPSPKRVGKDHGKTLPG